MGRSTIVAKARKRIDNGGVGEVVVGDPHAGKAPLKKRKKGGCLKAFIITLCVTVGVLAILIVGGLFIGDAVMKSNVGVSLFDVFAVIGDVGDYDKDKIVTNGYTESDVNEFYDSANKMLYFKTGADAVLNSAYIEELMHDTVQAGNADNLMASLLGILKSENFDAARLGAYEGWKDDVDHVGELTTISDRQFAAFFDDLVLGSGLIDEMIPDLANNLKDKAIADLVTLEQLIIRKGADMSEAALTEIGGVAEHAYMTLTVKVDLKQTVNALLPTLDAQAGFPVSMFGWLIDWILPDTTYATATVDLDDSAYGVNMELNRLAAEECEMGAAKEEIIAKYRDASGKITKMDRLFIVIESFAGQDVRENVNENAGAALGYICKSDSGFSVANAIETDTLTMTDNGDTFKIDLYGMLADILNEQTDGHASAEDIIVLMQSLVCTHGDGAYADDYAHRADLFSPADADLAQALKDCGFGSIEDIRTEEDYLKLKAAYGAIGYQTPGVDLTGQTNVFEREFMDALAQTYCLDLQKYNADGKPTGENYTFSEISALFGMEPGDGSASSLELTDLLDGAKFAQAAGDPNVRTLQLTDRMLGAVMRALMPDFVSSSGYGDYGLELRTLKIAQRVADDGLTHDMVTVVFSLKTSEMLKSEVVEYIGGVLPAYISMGLAVDMTPDLTAEQRLSAEITCYNEITSAGSADILNGLTSEKVVEALENIVPNINLKQLLGVMSDGISSVVDNMTAALPSFSFVPSKDNSSAYAAEFPSLFDLAAQLMGLNDPEKSEADRVSGDELKSAVNYLVNYTYDGGEVSANATYDAFLSSVQKNYYLSGQLTDFDSIFTSLTGSFDASALRLNEAKSYSYGGSTVWYNGMLYDPRSASELNVDITETDLVAIMREFAAASLADGTELVRAEVTEHGIALYVRIGVSSMLEEKYRALINCDYIYAAVKLDLDAPADDNGDGVFDRYEAAIAINGQSENGADYATLMRLIKAFGAADFDLDGIARDVGKAAYDALVNLDAAKLGYTLDAAGGKIVLPSFYDYAMTLLGVDKSTYTADDMKAAMQGIRAAQVNTDTVKYYVNEDGTNAAVNVNNFDAAKTILDPVSDDFDYLSKIEGVTDLNTPVSVYDNELGKVVSGKAAQSLGSLAQLAVIPNGAAKVGTAKDMYDVLGSYAATPLDADKIYVAFTFDAKVADLFSAGDNLAGVLPTDVYMTIVYTYDGGALDYAYLRVNGLTEKQQTLLVAEICGFDDFAANVAARANEARDMLSGIPINVSAVDSADQNACAELSMTASELLAAASHRI